MKTSLALLSLVLSCLQIATSQAGDRIATSPLDALPDDPAAAMVSGIEKFLQHKTEQAQLRRDQYWQQLEQLPANRKFLVERLGLEDQRHTIEDDLIFESPAMGTCSDFDVFRVRWPVLSHPAPQTAQTASLWAEGLFLGRPTFRQAPLLIFLPDADETPERFLTTRDSSDAQQALLARLATQMNVLIMATTSRAMHQHGNATLSRREYLHRSAFELGRTLTGYEIQSIQAAMDRFPDSRHVVVCGQGEGAMVALYAGAIDKRIDLTMVGGYFAARDGVWREPLSRQVFGVLSRFSDAHIALLTVPRALTSFAAGPYRLELPGEGGAPARWQSPSEETTRQEFEKFRQLATRLYPAHDRAQCLADKTFGELGSHIATEVQLQLPADTPEIQWRLDEQTSQAFANRRSQRLFATIDAYNQALLAESDHERAKFMNLGHSRTATDTETNQLDTSSVHAYTTSIEPFREQFREQTIGWYSDALQPLHARSMPAESGEGWTGHHVMIDVFEPSVFAYGVLLMPNDIQPGEKRPVVVCQHGLEGRPQDLIAGDHHAYHDFAARLASEGFIVFAPQNPYIGKDDFRVLQRRSYPLGKTLFSIIGVQHQQILRWLSTIPSVDSERIAFYGLSYGGKSAMRLPALLPKYCLSICSADFNDWVWKNASSRSRYSYVGTGEYEIFEFGLGKRFNYAEMAALIAPRPFMVERGHHDGVAPDDRVAKEFAKVRFLYQARLKLKDHCEIEWFDGPHTIHGQGTFEFLRRHLRWNTPSNSEN